jgi:hypothetical protein
LTSSSKSANVKILKIVIAVFGLILALAKAAEKKTNKGE